MIKTIALGLTFTTYEAGPQRVLDVYIDRTVLTDWCLHLALLEYDVIEELHVVDTERGLSLLVIGEQSPRRSLSLAKDDAWGEIQGGPQQFLFHIQRNELEYWLNNCLRYYAHGMADAPDLDTDVTALETLAGVDFTIVLNFADVRPPLSGRELARSLGIDVDQLADEAAEE